MQRMYKGSCDEVLLQGPHKAIRATIDRLLVSIPVHHREHHRRSSGGRRADEAVKEGEGGDGGTVTENDELSLKEATVRDLDGCVYHIEVHFTSDTAATATIMLPQGQIGGSQEIEQQQLESISSTRGRRSTPPHGGDERHRQMSSDDVTNEDRAADITISFRHVVPFNELNYFGNFDAVVLSAFPDITASFYSPSCGGSSSRDTCLCVVQIPSTASPQARAAAIEIAAQLRVLALLPVFTHVASGVSGSAEEYAMVRYHGPRGVMVLHRSEGSGSGLTVTITLDTKGMGINSTDEVVTQATSSSSSDGDSNDEDDIFLHHFLKACAEARSDAPAFSFIKGSKPPPSMPTEIASQLQQRLRVEWARDTYWCTFQLSARHLAPHQADQRGETSEKMRFMKRGTVHRHVALLERILNFRSDVMYHLQCNRAYMHTQMRRRVKVNLERMIRANTSATALPLSEL